MEIIKVTPRGYCKGVVRAISMAKEAVQKYPDTPIYVLGMLVHNRYIVDALKHMGIHTLESDTKSKILLLDDIEEGVVIFTAHGIDPKCIEKAKAKGLIVIDASCPDVLKTQELVKERLKQGYEILYIGKAGHPEATAVCSLSDHIHLLTSLADLKSVKPADKVFVTNQTTMSFQDIEQFFRQIHKRIPQAEFSQEICNATRIRQEAVAALKNIDLLYVVGDKASNNSNRLAEIAQANDEIRQVCLIENALDIGLDQLADVKRVAVTSGASTPTYLTAQVITFLEQQEKHIYPIIDINKML
ncbi:4-hydroxy-3-methylbut-2-enyl diphosphate reductase [Clostridiaceae bacterium DONG20-135]|uniref:4-hydroxy-3-methylbut-2-enyl diphosphate reductase n=1 Tax=Copranaerobaculum intestinale TaxID=2692629 RepID=A0A6N8UB40_9FIRM|nr:4-hydroxy-3-methylbut-2-enyl diphosphate reductase [Copranaerobaculum intestinale]MXQ73779.1 4-hydroxy-3-methylbut-2-enyl diphosphate reductase [Copranaerobaculum intestinale]